MTDVTNALQKERIRIISAAVGTNMGTHRTAQNMDNFKSSVLQWRRSLRYYWHYTASDHYFTQTYEQKIEMSPQN
jgi:hypothetical protein